MEEYSPVPELPARHQGRAVEGVAGAGGAAVHVPVQPEGGARGVVSSDHYWLGPALDIVTVVTWDNEPVMTNLSPVIIMKYEQ